MCVAFRFQSKHTQQLHHLKTRSHPVRQHLSNALGNILLLEGTSKRSVSTVVKEPSKGIPWHTWVEGQLGIQQLDDWYRVTSKDLAKIQAASWIEIHYGSIRRFVAAN